MEVTAKVRHLRMSPKKVRLVTDLVKGMDIEKAEAQLRFVRKAAARPVLKLLRSAKANAEHNFKLEPSGLFIKSIIVDGGPVLHRWRPRAFGRAAPIRKRSSHITLVLEERGLSGTAKGIGVAVVKEKGEKKVVTKKGAKGQATKKTDVKDAGKKMEAKVEVKTVVKKKTDARSEKKDPPKKAE